jgi:hypothetical protein
MMNQTKNQQNRDGSAPSETEPKPQLDESAGGLRGRDKAGGDMGDARTNEPLREGQTRERKGPYGKTTGRG